MLHLINAALLAQGYERVVENDGSEEWMILSQNWPQLVEAEIEDANYQFTMEEATTETRIAGSFGHDDAYLITADALHVRNVWVVESGGRYEIDWVQSGDYVHVNYADGITYEYAASTEVATWSALFSKGIQCLLEAIMLRVREEYVSAREMEKTGSDYLQRARTKSSASRSKQPALKRSSKSTVSKRLRRG
tara:strand:+ start:1202 stop:1777 length:576 start_codon:yes stop_codon:yes gene_type:complete